MRDLILDYIDNMWEVNLEYEFDANQIEIHLMDDNELLKLFVDIVRKYPYDPR
jgi:hypothetical protein